MSLSMSEEAEHLPAQPNNPWQLRTYAQLLASLEDGTLHADINDALREICSVMHEAVQSGTKSAASLSVTVKFKADRGLVEVNAEYGVKMPKPVRRRSMLHTTGAFFATRDERQAEMPLRSLPAENAGTRSL